jgi:hypothetical protein
LDCTRYRIYPEHSISADQSRTTSVPVGDVSANNADDFQAATDDTEAVEAFVTDKVQAAADDTEAIFADDFQAATGVSESVPVGDVRGRLELALDDDDTEMAPLNPRRVTHEADGENDWSARRCSSKAA